MFLHFLQNKIIIGAGTIENIESILLASFARHGVLKRHEQSK
jgi:hypothetical protein